MEKIVKILKKIKLRNIIILIILLAFNTYAWFIYATRVSTTLSVHVSSWNVEFVTGTGEIFTNMIIEVDRLFPGMETFEKNIEVHNKGEEKAKLSYEIESLKIMDQTYTVNESLTSEQLEEKIKTQYPFKVNIEKDDAGFSEQNGTGKFKITIDWPFESGNDELDTYWGNKAYEYYSIHPGEKSIQIKLKLIATQNEEGA